MKNRTTQWTAALMAVAIAGLAWTPAARADEGMWTFDNPPVERLQEKYGFAPSRAWLDRVRLSSVRFMDGGSGSFISPTGLVLTNHHVAVGQLQKMSTADHDYVKTGFCAESPADEIKCPDLELNVLVSMKDVTQDIAGAAKGLEGAKAIEARDARKAALTKEAKERTGHECEVVDLYQGGEYWLYCYDKYTDVRLVFAPERQAAYYGGDHDNFTYPRYDLDFAIFRVYDHGKPLHPPAYLPVNPEGATQGELVFVSGHPGRTHRLYTKAQLEFERDFVIPLIAEYFDRTIAALEAYSKRGDEQRRRALVRIFGLRNGQKAYRGMAKALRDPHTIETKARAESALRRAVASKPAWKERFGGAWDAIEGALRKYGPRLRQHYVERLWGASLANKAITIVQLARQLQKPDAERLDGFHDAQLDRLKFNLLSPAPIYRDLEAVKLATAIRFSLAHLPADAPYAELLRALGDPDEAARKLCESTKLVDVNVRKALVEGGMAAVEKSDDPLIELARRLAPLEEKSERWRKDVYDAIVVPASEKIGQARFAVYGKHTYPDATFTLRLAYGVVHGYPMNGTLAPYRTTLYGLFDRALGFDDQGEWKLPERFWKRQSELDLSTPVNFVCDADIVGGNSGSPVIDRQGRLVGVIFDGNIESLAGRYAFDPRVNRAVSVHIAYVLEALRKLYDAAPLAAEIERAAHEASSH